MQSGGEEAYECRVRWTELRGLGRVLTASAGAGFTDILGVGDESSSLALDPVDRIKDLRPGQTFLACFRQLQTSVVSSPSTQSPSTCFLLFSSIYTAIAWSRFAMRLRFQYHLQPTYILRVRISRFVLSKLHAWGEQARTDATSWRCLHMGILFDLLVDAACKVAGVLVPSFSTLFGTDSANIVYERPNHLSGHSTVEADLVKPTYTLPQRVIASNCRVDVGIL
jgi:hypothetical protein